MFFSRCQVQFQSRQVYSTNARWVCVKSYNMYTYTYTYISTNKKKIEWTSKTESLVCRAVISLSRVTPTTGKRDREALIETTEWLYRIGRSLYVPNKKDRWLDIDVCSGKPILYFENGKWWKSRGSLGTQTCAIMIIGFLHWHWFLFLFPLLTLFLHSFFYFLFFSSSIFSVWGIRISENNCWKSCLTSAENIETLWQNSRNCPPQNICCLVSVDFCLACVSPLFNKRWKERILKRRKKLFCISS